ncbi:MAG TPA: DUF1843 domain-containing protein [Candidatus Angelobacter sp.]|nr:DUF1843 domain-containing protein [Candidatus Angelobacter sp.]
MAVPPYGTAIHQAVASGNLAQMKAMVQYTEAYLKEWGDVRTALEFLKAEIAKREANKGKSKGERS